MARRQAGRGVQDIAEVFSDGPCKGCRRKRDCHRGRCLPCRTPADRRELVEAGVPCGSAYALVMTAKKCRSPREAQKVLELVHPTLMANVVVGRGMVMRLRSGRYHWVRRNGWSSGATR